MPKAKRSLLDKKKQFQMSNLFPLYRASVCQETMVMQNRRLPTEAHSSLTEIAIIVFAISLAISCLELRYDTIKVIRRELLTKKCSDIATSNVVEGSSCIHQQAEERNHG